MPRFKLLALLLAVIALALLLTFALVNFFQKENVVPETLETVLWQKQVPHEGQVFDFDEIIEKPFMSQNLDYSPKIIMYEYALSVDGSSSVDFDINFTASTGSQGYIENALVTLNCSETGSLDIQLSYLNPQNLSLVDYGYGGSAFMRLNAKDHPLDVSFSGKIIWSIFTKTQISKLHAAFELTYFNGTVHKDVIQPFQLTISWT